MGKSVCCCGHVGQRQVIYTAIANCTGFVPIPAIFMSAACYTFLAYNKIGFGLDYQLSVYIGFGLTILTTAAFFLFVKRERVAGDPDALVFEPKV